MMSNSTTTVQREQPATLAACQQALAAAQQDVATLNDKYLRAAAALDNARKQAERDMTSRVNQRTERLMFNMLDVTDTLERALTYSTPDTPLHSGLQATHQQLLAVLRGEGVVPIQIVIGTRLDPLRHEAVGTRSALEPHLTIVHVERNGYLREGQVLRPAQVIVSDPGPL
jgi:molecular chaperone GrpE